MRTQVRYWRSTTGDRRSGGYRVRDYGAPRLSRLHRWHAREHAAKQVVAQSRLVWTFAHAYLAGWGTDADLRAARQGLDFLTAHFWDTEDGGWIWQTARDGTWLDDRKNLIAQVSVLLAFGRIRARDRRSRLAPPGRRDVRADRDAPPRPHPRRLVRELLP